MSKYFHKNINTVRTHIMFIFIAAIFAGVVIDYFISSPFLPEWLSQIIGIILLIIASTGLIWVEQHRRRRDKHVLSGITLTSEHMAKGPYSFSRNPTYMGLTFLAFAFAVLSDSLIMFGITVVAWFAAHLYVVHQEEKYLANIHEDHFHEYKSKVKRWL